MRISRTFFLLGWGMTPICCCMKWACWCPGHPEAGLVWFNLWSLEMWIPWWGWLVGITFCSSFPVGDIYSRITAMAGWVRGVTLVCMKQRLSSINPDLGMCKPAAWEGTGSFPWLRFIWRLISIALKSHSPTWSACWYCVLFCTLQVGWQQFQKEERLNGGQGYKNIRGKLGLVWESLHIFTSSSVSCSLTESHFSKTTLNPKTKQSKTKPSFFILRHSLHKTLTVCLIVPSYTW